MPYIMVKVRKGNIKKDNRRFLKIWLGFYGYQDIDFHFNDGGSEAFTL